MSPTFADLAAAGPASIITLFALLVITIEALKDKSESLTSLLTIVGFIAAIAVASTDLQVSGKAFNGMISTGGYANFFAIVFSVAGVLSVMLSRSYIATQEIEHGEFYALLLIAVLGMIFMASAANLIVFFLGLEMMSISFYILAGFLRSRTTSNEAALKYFLLGAFATGFLLYGIALIYGSTGTTDIDTILEGASLSIGKTTFVIGLGLLLIGLVFKIAAVPFHMWVPDVYEGSPTTVSGFMSTGGKAAAFSALLLIFAPRLTGLVGGVREVLAVLAALSMIVGNVIAIAQSNIKRMLAYSSIAHAGYMLTGVVAANAAGSNGVLFYLVAYTMMNIGAFGVLSMLEARDGSNLVFDDYAGLSTRRPFLAGLMALFMFSLTGIPPFAGFFGKYYVFVGAVEAGYTWLAILGVLMSVVSAYYYLRLVVLMYFKEQVSTLDSRVSKLGVAALVASAAALVVLGLFPSSVLTITAHFF
jgi:NADH-quinone oxidoreductase subunit N